MKYRIASVFGTRPEAIKMAPVVKALEKSNYFSNTVVVTAQHREMLDQVLELFSIAADYDLNIMKERQKLSQITSNVLLQIEQVINEINPDMMLVHGDTTTTFAAALSAYYQQVAIGHVEAGLRTGNKYAPFPEEMNRKLVSALADINFAPTSDAKENLKAEGVSGSKIFVTGNTVVDALQTSVQEEYVFSDAVLAGHIDYSIDSRPEDEKKLITLEVHRRENWGPPMREIFYAVKDLVEAFPWLRIVFPVHRNPAVREPAREILGACTQVLLTEPLSTRDFHNLIARSYLILTDSGGIQEEAPSFGVPVLVLRELTEREEGIRQGTVILAGNDRKKIFQTTKNLLFNDSLYRKMKHKQNPYGDGKASNRIEKVLEYFYGIEENRPEDFKVKPS